MKPKISILDPAFAYQPSYATAIADTWRRFGWRPTRRDAQEQGKGSRSCKLDLYYYFSQIRIERGLPDGNCAIIQLQGRFT